MRGNKKDTLRSHIVGEKLWAGRWAVDEGNGLIEQKAVGLAKGSSL